MLSAIKQNIVNLKGWKTKRKIVVIESDDWGSIRMPSKQVYDALVRKGYKVDTDPYLKFDSLATSLDLEHLFDSLQQVKDKNNNCAVITANAVMANPDFEKIREDEYNNYYYEPFIDTLSKQKGCEKSFNLWQQGINEKIFVPQYHGREHLNISQWMKSLKEGDKTILEAFDNKMISISSEPSHMKFHYMEGMDYYNEEELSNQSSILEEGMSLFEQILHYKSKSYIANCYVWGDNVEEVLSKKGVEYLQGVRVQKKPRNINGVHSYEYVANYLGKMNQYSQTYLLRNAYFEPSQWPNINAVDSCYKQIASAFFWNKPAIICSHRLNFIGAISEKNRIDNLKALTLLLKKVVQKWPEVEFMTSVQLGDLITEKSK
jgi:hypothetical protein